MHFPFGLLHFANCVHVSDSVLQLKHEGQGGQPSGRPSKMVNWSRLLLWVRFEYAVAVHVTASIARAKDAARILAMGVVRSLVGTPHARA